MTSVLFLLFHPKTVHCSTKNAYTSEITFLALVPWKYTQELDIKTGSRQNLDKKECQITNGKRLSDQMDEESDLFVFLS